MKKYDNMKVVILAGGFGTRISEESHLRPKPMIEIGELPIIVHIMKMYAKYGYKEFIICAGYKQHMIKEYFAHYFLYNNDVTFDMTTNKRIIHNKSKDDWKVTVVDTGINTQTGGRIKRIQDYVGHNPFMVAYGDAVGDINVFELVNEHIKSGKLATITCYNFGQSKGIVDIKDGEVKGFREKSNIDGNVINIGYMVMEPDVFDFIKDDNTILEKEPISKLVEKKQLHAYIHRGYWQCMDTLREKQKLEELWNSGKAPWKIWEE